MDALRSEPNVPFSRGRSSGDATRRTILLADDEPAIVVLIARVLRGAGFHVLTARDGREAVNVFRANESEVDLLVFDAMMPELSGYRAMLEVRETHPDMPVVFCSGYSEEVALDGRDLPPNSVMLAKPFHVHDLLESAERLIGTIRPSGR